MMSGTIVVIIFGANRLPQLGQGIGSAIKNFKGAMSAPDEPTSSAQLGTCASCATVNPCGFAFLQEVRQQALVPWIGDS